jgi:hypothetical protein
VASAVVNPPWPCTLLLVDRASTHAVWHRGRSRRPMGTQY